MSERRVLLDTAAFMDSSWSLAITGAATADIRTIVQRFLETCYQDLGKAPRLLDGEDVTLILNELLPRHFGVRDPLAAAVEEVLGAFLAFLRDTAVVPAAFEQGQALAAHTEEFAAAVRSGAAHRDGIAVTGQGETVVHRAAKVGRNDPCPCGSGRKFKKCCMGLGEG